MSTSNGAFPPLNEEHRDLLGNADAEFKSPEAVDPNNPWWGFLGAFVIWIVSIALQFIIPLFFVVPYILQKVSPASPEFGRLAGEIALTDRTAILLQVISIFPTHLLTIGIVWAFVTRLRKRPFLASFGWTWSPKWGALEGLSLVVFGILLFGLGGLIAQLLGSEKPTQLEQLINSSIGARYAIAVLAVFTAPFVEEFIYRGLLYSALQRTLGTNAAVVMVLALFTLIHVPQYWPNVGVISAVALLSIVLTVVRARTGRLLPCVIIHMAFNAVQAVLLVFEPIIRRFLPIADPPVPNASFFLPLIRLIF